MTKLIRSLIVTAVFVTMLTSCNLFNNDTQNATPQPTPALLPTGVVIELSVQPDTSVPYNTVGQVIKYNHNVKNIGTLPAPGPVTITGATCPDITTVGNKDAMLDINEVVVCTSSYTITQADLDKGSVTTVTMANVGGVNSNQVTTTVATVAPTILKLTKTANPVTYSQVGQVNYLHVRHHQQRRNGPRTCSIYCERYWICNTHQLRRSDNDTRSKRNRELYCCLYDHSSEHGCRLRLNKRNCIGRRCSTVTTGKCHGYERHFFRSIESKFCSWFNNTA